MSKRTKEPEIEVSEGESVITPPEKRWFSKKRLFIAIIAIIVLIPLVYAGYIYAASPEVVRKPKFQHYHFRMQILVDGKAEDFSEAKYQQDYSKNQCNVNLTEQPIHFHDFKDQFVHIHWDGMTGGMVMKYYGWNQIGGLNNALGYKLDNLRDIQKVTTHGNQLPAVPAGSNYYVYVGDEKGYQEKNFNDWKTQDLEQFFGVKSNLPEEGQQSLLDRLFPKVSAHAGHEHPEGEHDETEEEKLTRINNLLGNVVIFVQKDKPSDQQIKDRFNQLTPLSDSTCGG